MSWFNIKSTNYLAAMTALWTLLLISLLFQLQHTISVPLTVWLTWLIIGAIAGAAFGAIVTLRQLNSLEKKNQLPTTLKTLLIQLGLIVVLISVILEVFATTSTQVISLLLYSLTGALLAVSYSGLALLVHWERKNHQRIHQNNWRFYLSTEKPAGGYVQASADQPVLPKKEAIEGTK